MSGSRFNNPQRGGNRTAGPPPRQATHGGPQDTGDAGLRALLEPPKERFQYFLPNSQPNSNSPRAAMLDDEARQVAEEMASLPASQLRRFYGTVMALRRRLELDTDGKKVPNEEIRSQLALLKAQAAYTRKRNSRCPDELVRFFVRHAASVQNREDFLRGFQPHFEAVVAYHKVFEQKGNSE